MAAETEPKTYRQYRLEILTTDLETGEQTLRTYHRVERLIDASEPILDYTDPLHLALEAVEFAITGRALPHSDEDPTIGIYDTQPGVSLERKGA